MIPRLESLEERLAPSAAPVYGGGPVLSNPQVAILFLGTSTPDPSFVQQVNDIAGGPYASGLAQYGVSPGKINAVAADPVSVPPGVDASAPGAPPLVQQALTQEIASGALPSPGPSQEYVVVLPQGTTLTAGTGAAAGVHGVFTVPPGAGLAGTPFEPFVLLPLGPYQTTAFSNEYIESVTNPIGGGPGGKLNGWTVANAPPDYEIGSAAGFTSASRYQLGSGEVVQAYVNSLGQTIEPGAAALVKQAQQAVQQTTQQIQQQAQQTVSAADQLFLDLLWLYVLTGGRL